MLWILGSVVGVIGFVLMAVAGLMLFGQQHGHVLVLQGVWTERAWSLMYYIIVGWGVTFVSFTVTVAFWLEHRARERRRKMH